MPYFFIEKSTLKLVININHNIYSDKEVNFKPSLGVHVTVHCLNTELTEENLMHVWLKYKEEI